MYFVNTPHIIKLFYPSVIWNFKEKEKIIYLTFDDGPDENITPEVLDLLDKYNAKATFFCVGQKVKENTEIFNTILIKGHSVGNHTYNHLKGGKISTKLYLQNTLKANEIINSKLFRPPYGSFTARQIKTLHKMYKIILWSVLPGDFDKIISKEKVLNRAIRYTKPGSIIVFHDNNKFRDKMIYALSAYLEHFKLKGYNFKAISMDL